MARRSMGSSLPVTYDKCVPRGKRADGRPGRGGRRGGPGGSGSGVGSRNATCSRCNVEVVARYATSY